MSIHPEVVEILILKHKCQPCEPKSVGIIVLGPQIAICPVAAEIFQSEQLTDATILRAT